MSGLQKTPVSWPITGGIQSKNAPIMLSPGANIFLDNVRQERLNEWRTRGPMTQSAADDFPGGLVPVISTEAPWGGLVGLVRGTDATSCGRIYNPLAATRWHVPQAGNVGATLVQTCSQLTPGIWARQAIGPALGDVPWQSNAEGGGYRLTAWGSIGSGISVALTTTDGAALQYTQTYDANGVRPCCVYSSTANRLALFYTDGAGNILAATWDSTTGAPVITPTIISAHGRAATDCFLQAIWYGGTTMTVAFRDNVATGGLRIIEYNPATGVGTEYTPGQDCSKALTLMPEPDASGFRYVAVGSAVPDVRVVRLNNVGVIQTNDVADTVDPTQIAGVAYTNGTEWAIVYGPTIAGEMPWYVKRAGGVTSTPVQLGPATAANAAFTLMSGGWREPGTDAMRYMLMVNGANNTSDPQATFLEMAVNFVRATGTDTNRWTEPQARLLPLNAYPNAPGGLGRSALPQVFRTGTDRYVTALVRQTGFNLPADGSTGTTYAVDAWSVQYMNGTTYTGQNQGQGTHTQQAAYLPVGSLLQTATGQLLCSHGASSLPFQPTATPSAGGGLTAGQAYALVVTTELYDEAGNIWPSQPSVAAKVTAAAMAGMGTITWVATNTPLENQARRRTVKFWRTQGNGSTYFLVHQVNDTIANTVRLTFADTIPDTSLGQPLSGEVQGTITPAMSHVTEWNGRLWGIERDFPRVRYSKPIQQGFSPVFPPTFFIDTSDELGAATGIAALDDRIVLLKTRGVYVQGGDGPDNQGNGVYGKFTRISSETGNIVGGPYLATGSEVYITSLGGVFRVPKTQAIDFVGAALDAYLDMPLLQSPETVTGMVLSPGKNEVRVQTTHYRFVHDRVFNVWERDTGGFTLGTIVATKMLSGTTQVCLTSDGHLWVEGADTNAPSDPGTPYQGLIRSPWIRPTGVGGWLRLYRARFEGWVTTAGTVSGAEFRVFFNDNDNQVEAFTPAGNIAGSPGLIRADIRTVQQKCTSFSLQLKLPTTDATVRLEEWWVVVGAKMSAPPPLQADRWGGTVIPPPPSAPLLIPVPRISTVPTLVTGTLIGGGSPFMDNTRWMVWAVKNQLVASGWHVVQSYNANGVIPAPGVDTWVSYTDLKGTGGGGTGDSWIVLGNSVNTRQILINVNVTFGWVELAVSFDPAGSFAGGTTTTPPTSATAVPSQLQSASPFGTGAGSGPTNRQFYAAVWVAPDLSYTRIAWIDGPTGMCKQIWQFDELPVAPTGWTNNCMGVFYDWQNTDVSAPGHRPTLVNYFAAFGSAGISKIALTPGPNTVNSMEGSLTAANNGLPIADLNTTPNAFSNQWPWFGGFTFFRRGAAANLNGDWGVNRDQWFVPNVFNDGDTMGDHFDFIILGQVVLQWGLGNPTSVWPGTTNYPTARFMGAGSAV